MGRFCRLVAACLVAAVIGATAAAVPASAAVPPPEDVSAVQQSDRTPTGAYAPVWQQDAKIHGYLVDVSAIAIGDATGDGRPDLAMTGGGNRPGARVGVYPGQPGGGPGTEALGYATWDVPDAGNRDHRALAIGDVSGDGRPDVVIADADRGLILVRQA